MVNYSFSLQTFEYFILILVRISCFVYIAPFFGTQNIFERFGAQKLTAVGWALEIDAVYLAIRKNIDYEGGQ